MERSAHRDPAGSGSTTAPRVDAHDDPLHDPTWPIFIYSGWAVASWYLDAWIGLMVLVTGAAALAVAAARADHHAADPPFLSDFNVVLLFCAASIGGTVLVLEALDRWQDLALASSAYCVAAGLVLQVFRRHRAEPARTPSIHDRRQSSVAGTEAGR